MNINKAIHSNLYEEINKDLATALIERKSY